MTLLEPRTQSPYDSSLMTSLHYSNEHDKFVRCVEICRHFANSHTPNILCPFLSYIDKMQFSDFTHASIKQAARAYFLEWKAFHQTTTQGQNLTHRFIEKYDSVLGKHNLENFRALAESTWDIYDVDNISQKGVSLLRKFDQKRFFLHFSESNQPFFRGDCVILRLVSYRELTAAPLSLPIPHEALDNLYLRLVKTFRQPGKCGSSWSDFMKHHGSTMTLWCALANFSYYEPFALRVTTRLTRTEIALQAAYARLSHTVSGLVSDNPDTATQVIEDTLMAGKHVTLSYVCHAPILLVFDSKDAYQAYHAYKTGLAPACTMKKLSFLRLCIAPEEDFDEFREPTLMPLRVTPGYIKEDPSPKDLELLIKICHALSKKLITLRKHTGISHAA